MQRYINIFFPIIYLYSLFFVIINRNFILMVCSLYIKMIFKPCIRCLGEICYPKQTLHSQLYPLYIIFQLSGITVNTIRIFKTTNKSSNSKMVINPFYILVSKLSCIRLHIKWRPITISDIKVINLLHFLTQRYFFARFHLPFFAFHFIKIIKQWMLFINISHKVQSLVICHRNSC